MGQSIKVGIAADHGGFEMKQALIEKLLAEGHEVEDFGADTLDPDDDYPDYIIPLGRAVVAGDVERGIASAVAVLVRRWRPTRFMGFVAGFAMTISRPARALRMTI